METVDADVLGVHLEHFVATDGEHKSTVGMMLTNCVVDNMLQGAPAAMSGRIKKGDVVLEARSHACVAYGSVTHCKNG